MSKNSHSQLGQPEGRRVGNICSLLNTFLLGPTATQKHRRPSVYACCHTSVIITHPSCPLFAPSRRPCVLPQLHHPFSRPWFAGSSAIFISCFGLSSYTTASSATTCHPPPPRTVTLQYMYCTSLCYLHVLFCLPSGIATSVRIFNYVLLIFAHIHL